MTIRIRNVAADAETACIGDFFFPNVPIFLNYWKYTNAMIAMISRFILKSLIFPFYVGLAI